MAKVLTGIDVFEQEEWKNFKGYRLGLLANQASVNSQLSPSRDIIAMLLPGQLKAMFSPQHGIGGQDQDNMIESPHTIDKNLNIPIFSLYSETREPTRDMFELIDVLIIDLQDVGTRVYTFAATMLNCLKAASRFGKKVVVLDRPNPLGGDIVEGNLLEEELFSFVGVWRLPMRHGLTFGELALLFNDVFGLECDLEIIAMKGWKRSMLWHQTGLKWIMPSPNLPCVESAYVYPGQVIWEGTNVSEGRGTCRPFEIFGAPFFNMDEIKAAISKNVALKGFVLQDFVFRPTFNKWMGKICHGFMIHILDHKAYRPYITSLWLLKTILSLYPDKFEWKQPPYEYVYDQLPIDLIIGSYEIREKLQFINDVNTLSHLWGQQLENFCNFRQTYFLYP